MKPLRHVHRTAGFSLLELATVIVIVASLMAVALPRYRDAQRYARIAMLDNMALLMMGAVDQFHWQCLAAQARDLREDCREVRVGLWLVRGELTYPQAGLDGIGRLVGLVPGEPAADQFRVESTRLHGQAGLKVALRHAENGTCELMYLAPAGVGQRPEITVLQSTCS
jgi:prepilin-type N-terminal cleavage/methylation domain-containing protein